MQSFEFQNSEDISLKSFLDISLFDSSPSFVVEVLCVIFVFYCSLIYCFLQSLKLFHSSDQCQNQLWVSVSCFLYFRFIYSLLFYSSLCSTQFYLLKFQTGHHLQTFSIIWINSPNSFAFILLLDSNRFNFSVIFSFV